MVSVLIRMTRLASWQAQIMTTWGPKLYVTQVFSFFWFDPLHSILEWWSIHHTEAHISGLFLIVSEILEHVFWFLAQERQEDEQMDVGERHWRMAFPFTNYPTRDATLYSVHLSLSPGSPSHSQLDKKQAEGLGETQGSLGRVGAQERCQKPQQRQMQLILQSSQRTAVHDTLISSSFISPVFYAYT